MRSIPCTSAQVAPLRIRKELITDDVLHAKVPEHLGGDDTTTPCQLFHLKSSCTADKATFILMLLVLCALELGEAHALVGANMLLILLCFRTLHDLPQYVKGWWVQVAFAQGLCIPPADNTDPSGSTHYCHYAKKGLHMARICNQGFAEPTNMPDKVQQPTVKMQAQLQH